MRATAKELRKVISSMTATEARVHWTPYLFTSAPLHNCKLPPSGSGLFHSRFPDCPLGS